MARNIIQRLSLGMLLLAALFVVVTPVVRAAGETVYLTPASGSKQTGETFTVSVDGYVGQSYWWWLTVGANSVDGSINFPTQQLKVVSIDTSGAAFPNGSVTPNNTTGKITFNGTSSGMYTNQNVHLFSIKFQTVAPGNASVTFGPTQYNLGPAATNTGSYSVTSPPAPSPSPSPSPTPTPRPTTTPKPSTSPAPIAADDLLSLLDEDPIPEETPAPTNESEGGLKIENVKMSTSLTENKITWTINNPSVTPTLNYGSAKDKQTTEATITKSESGTYSAVLPSLNLGSLYYFTIKAKTTDELQGANYTGTLTTKGYPVRLTVQQNNLLIPGAKVKTGERSFTANKNAIITAEFASGEHQVTITPPGDSKTYNTKFTVAKKTIPTSGSLETQSFVLNVTTDKPGASFTNSSLLPIIASIAGIIVFIGGVVGYILFRRNNQSTEQPSVDSDLLLSNYGPAIQEPRVQTPVPNLETAGAMNTIAPEPIIAEPVVQEQTVQEETLQNDQAMPQTSFDPQALPLPPVSEPALPIQNQAATTEQTIDSSQTLQLPTPEPAEQLSSELAAVESIEETQSETPEQTSDEPSAVYDASTGELDIIHHAHPSGTAPMTEQTKMEPQ